MTAEVSIRALERSELGRLWEIDRRELVHEVYEAVGARLTLRSQRHDTQAWPDGEPEADAPKLRASFDAGGAFFGAFAGSSLVAAGGIDARPVHDYPELRQLVFLHVSNDWRGQRIAWQLYQTCQRVAAGWGAAGMYISATSTRRTVDFYRRQGAAVLEEPDRELLAAEPEDIHLAHWF